MKKFLYIGIGLFLCLSNSLAQSKEELQQRKQRAQEELNMARELMAQTSNQRVASLQELRIIQKGINSRAALIQNLEKELELVEQEVQDAEISILELERENSENKEEYARMVYFAYRNHTDYEKLMYILAGESISQSYQRYKFLKYISDYRIKKAEEIEGFIDELEKQIEGLSVLRSEKLQLLEEKETEQNKLLGQRRSERRVVNQLKEKEAQLQKEIQEKERISLELEQRIREIIEEEARKSGSENIYASLTPEQELLGTDFRNNKGKLPWPVDKGIITLGYGKHEVQGLRGSTIMNNGVDISSVPGTLVRSIFNGEVTKVFAIKGANYTVLIRHGQFLSVYQNLVNVRVKTGDQVGNKEVIGEAFSDEHENIAILHFELWQERKTLNPEQWISR